MKAWFFVVFFIYVVSAMYIDDNRVPATKITLNVGDSPYCNSSYCDSDQTCCTLDDGDPGCCPLFNATCCGVGDVCCPDGYLCDPVAKDCVKQAPSAQCDYCAEVVEYFESQGCDALCPECIPVCEFIEALDLCQEIINWSFRGYSAEAICGWVGFCSGGTCACGYCTRYTYGRCLSTLNHCPSNEQQYHLRLDNNRTGICFDGQCEPGMEGCCMTCL